MQQRLTKRDKIAQLIVLLFPILITQIGMYSMMIFLTIMSGNYHSADLAGVAIGSSLWNPVFIGLSGILLAISPIVAQGIGEKNKQEVISTVVHGVYLAIMISLLVILAGAILLDPVLQMMNLEKRVHEIAFHYLIGLSFGIIPLFTFNALRSFVYGLGKTRIIMVILLTAMPLNLFFNYCLIFGKWYFPELGGAGGGYAIAITYWYMMLVTLLVVMFSKPYRHYFKLRFFKQFSLQKCKDILKIGIPMGLSMFFETSMFAVVTLLISRYSVATIAAYQSALNIVSFIYMVPVSLAQAITVVVGYEVGAERNKDANEYSWIGMKLAVGIAIVTSLAIFAFRDSIAVLYSNETEVIELTAKFLIFAAIFHIFDAIQVTAQAALRGYKDVTPAFIITLIAYWIICIPTGFVLANFTGLSVYGYWIGLSIGLILASIVLTIRLIYIQRVRFVPVPSNVH